MLNKSDIRRKRFRTLRTNGQAHDLGFRKALRAQKAREQPPYVIRNGPTKHFNDYTLTPAEVNSVPNKIDFEIGKSYIGRVYRLSSEVSIGSYSARGLEGYNLEIRCIGSGRLVEIVAVDVPRRILFADKPKVKAENASEVRRFYGLEDLPDLTATVYRPEPYFP